MSTSGKKWPGQSRMVQKKSLSTNLQVCNSLYKARMHEAKAGNLFSSTSAWGNLTEQKQSAWLPPRLGSITTPFDSHGMETSIYRPKRSICTKPYAKQWIGCVSIDVKQLRKFGWSLNSIISEVCTTVCHELTSNRPHLPAGYRKSRWEFTSIYQA